MFSIFSLAKTDILQSTHLERELQIFTPPDIEAGIVCAKPLKEGLIDGKQTSRHGRGSHGLGGVLVAGALLAWDRVPVELLGVGVGGWVLLGVPLTL